MGFRWGKGGGAQLGNVGQRGWVVSVNDYKGRFNSTMTNYLSTRAAGGDFHIYVHDLWGTDHASSTSHWPGDNGDFTSYDQFVQQLMSDGMSTTYSCSSPTRLLGDVGGKLDLG
jgi:hypothetical protein